MGNCTPKVAGIYITRKCNLNCGYCTVKDKKIDELTLNNGLRQ
jgi:MoaA/NifB/PqqE/SkfB family radical SAM enzyme